MGDACDTPDTPSSGGSNGPINKRPNIDFVSFTQQEGYDVLLSVDAHDTDGEIVRYKWRFNDTLSFSTPMADITHTFDGPGIYEVTVTVEDNHGNNAGVAQHPSKQIIRFKNYILVPLPCALEKRLKQEPGSCNLKPYPEHQGKQ